MPIPSTTTAVASGRLLLADVVYDRLLGVIVSGELAPGEVVREEEIGEWLGVSRTPVRDAMRRLGEQGLLDYQPNRGSHVSALHASDLGHIVEVVAALYGMAGRLAVAQLGDDDFAEIDVHVARILEAYRGGDRVHRAAEVSLALRVISSHSGNPVLERALALLSPHLVRLQTLAPMYPTEDEIVERFTALDAALRTRDPELVGQTMQAYVLHFGRALLGEAVKSGVAS